MTTLMFVDVDTQFDFCNPDGALFVANAPEVMPRIQALIRRAVTQADLLVGSVDTHDFTAWEFARNGGPFPDHCVKGTPGWLKMPGTLPERTVFVPNTTVDATIVPDEASHVLFEKEVYSMFANPSAEAVLDNLLSQRGTTKDEIRAVVFGIATDYCVKAAALGLRERGYAVDVVTDAIAAVAHETGEAALTEMKEAGCRLVTTGSYL